METKNEKSPAYQLVELTWQHCDRSSWLKINSSMFNSVCHAVRSGLNFNIDDFSDFINNFRGGYWFYVNSGGKGYPNCGSRFYSIACEVGNISACLSFEKWAKIKPFIIKNTRMAVDSLLLDKSNKRRIRVTGFDLENNKIMFVCYEINDSLKDGPRSLLNFTNKEWLTARKTLEMF